MASQYYELDIKKLAEVLPDPTEHDEIRILAFWGNQPIGWTGFKFEEDEPIEAFDANWMKNEILKRLGWEAWQLAVSGNLSNTLPDHQPPISVIVCTRDRKSSLERCLESLKVQDYPVYEVVVVDNCSLDKTIREMVLDNDFIYVREDRPGLDWARNRGIQEASHEIIAFIDDDAIAPTSWLRGIASGFYRPEIMLVTGLVIPGEMEMPAQFDFEAYGGMGKGFRRLTIKPETLTPPDKFWASSWGVGANMAFRRSLIESIGGFDVALDVGTPSCGGGDIEFYYRTIDAGHTLHYEPRAWIRHFHRKEQEDLERQIYNNGRSFPNYLMTIVRNQPQKRWSVLWFAIYHWLWHWLLRRLLSAMIRADLQLLRFAWTELRGSFSALPSYWRSQRAAERLKAAGENPTSNV